MVPRASAQVTVGIGIGPGYYAAPISPDYNSYCDPRSPYYYPYYCNGYYGYYGPAYYNGYYGYFRPTYYGYWPFVGLAGYYHGYYGHGGYYRGYYGHGGYYGGFRGGGGLIRLGERGALCARVGRVCAARRPDECRSDATVGGPARSCRCGCRN